MADADDEIREEVLRDNPRRKGESQRSWDARFSRILSRAAKRYYRDLEAIREETGADVETARRFYRDSLGVLGKQRRQVNRDDVVGTAADIAEAEEKPEKIPEVDVVFDGDEYVYELQMNREAEVEEALPDGSRSYEADVYLTIRGGEPIRETVTFSATVESFWAEFHAAARAWVEPVIAPYQVEIGPGRYGGSFKVTQIRVTG